MPACKHNPTEHCGCDDGRNCPWREQSATLADLDATINRWQSLHDTADQFSDDPDMDRSEFAVTLKHLRAYRSSLAGQDAILSRLRDENEYAQEVLARLRDPALITQDVELYRARVFGVETL